MYTPLTKKELSEGGSETIACSFSGTAVCRAIHNTGKCDIDCPIFRAILTQLNVFETIYMEEDRNGDEVR